MRLFWGEDLTDDLGGGLEVRSRRRSGRRSKPNATRTSGGGDRRVGR
jgi:hypothetical protein